MIHLFEYSKDIAISYLFKKSYRKRTIRFSTILCILGISFGIASFLVSESLLNGFQSGFTNKILGVLPEIQIQHLDSNFSEQLLKEVKLKLSSLDFIKAIDRISMLSQVSNISRGKNRKKVIKNQKIYYFGLDLSNKRDAILNIGNNIEKGAKYFNIVGSSNFIAAGTDLQKLLNLVPGDELNIFNDKQNLYFNFQTSIATNFDQVKNGYFIFLDIQQLKKFFSQIDEHSQIAIKTFCPNCVNDYREILKTILGERYKISTWRDVVGDFDIVLVLIKRICFFISLIIIFISLYYIPMTITMIVMEKTKDIGILMSLGSSRLKINLIFLFIAAFYTITGILIGILLSFVINYFMSIILSKIVVNMIGFNKFSFSINALTAMILFFICFVVTLVGSFFPANRASRMKIIEALEGR